MTYSRDTTRLLVACACIAFLSACGADHPVSAEPDNAAAVAGNSQGEPAENPNANIEGQQASVSNIAPLISGSPATTVEAGATYSFTPVASDRDGDELVFFIENQPSWATFDSYTGELTGSPDYTHVGVVHDIRIAAEDGSDRSEITPFAIEVVMDEVELALASGDASVVSRVSALEDALIDSIDSATNLHADAISRIFNLNADGTARADGSSLTVIDWNPTHDAARISSAFGENSDLLTTNSVFATGYEIREDTMGVIGESSARYIVLGGNPMRNYRRDSTALNEQMHQFLENSLAWLTARGDLKSSPFKVVMAQLEQSHYFPDELAVREWIDERFPGRATYNEQNACDDVALAACIAGGADLLVISRHTNTDGVETVITEAVQSAMKQGIPVLYMHLDGGTSELADELFRLFDVSYFGDNYWRKLGFDGYDPTIKIGTPSDNISAVRKMANNFRQNNFVIDWIDCVKENCNENDSLNTEFRAGAKYVQSLMQALDNQKTDLFEWHDKYRFRKLLALLGDYYRMHVSFPMDRKITPGTEFLRAFYADHSAYQYRSQVGVWSDSGNFGRTDFSHVTTVSRTVRHTSKKNFKPTGAYALPGHTVSVTRKDNSDVGVSVFVNSLRSGSTHTFADFGYNRPRFLQGQSMMIEPGETIQFTSSIGGPIHLKYDANDLPVEIVFENVGEHAYWRSAADDASFSEKLYADDFDWAEIAAPGFEVHSTRMKMVESMANPMFGEDGGTPQELVDATMRYVHNFPHVLAGLQGPGVEVVNEIHQFARDNALAVAALDRVKHMNADQASCGYGCSGNPYDAYWSFSPIGHGDIHELGHGLERSRFRFSGWPGHASTNFYSYYTKTQYFKDTGENPDCQSLPFESMFNTLQKSLSEANPAGYVKVNLWDNVGWSQGAAMIIQMMMAAEDNGALIDGWHLLARMHIIEREYIKALANDTTWLDARESLGMNLYGRNDAKSMSPEDWLLVVVSHATGFDHRNYFDVWAHGYTEQAAAQVGSMSLPSMPLNYYVSSGSGYCKGEGFDGSKLPLDGLATWPSMIQ